MSTHLSNSQVNEIKQLLNERFRQLQNDIHDHLLNAEDGKYADIAGQVHDMGDESVADLLADLNYTVIDNHVRELQAIEKTLYQIQTGDQYGVCIDCGIDIPFERLQVAPTTTRCFNCQQDFEKKYKRGA